MQKQLITKRKKVSQAWWCRPVISALGSPWSKNLLKVDAARTARDTQKDLASKIKKAGARETQVHLLVHTW